MPRPPHDFFGQNDEEGDDFYEGREPDESQESDGPDDSNGPNGAAGWPAPAHAKDTTGASDDPALRDPEPRAVDVVLAANAPILDLSERWERVTLEEKVATTWVRTEMPTHLDPADWNTGFVRVVEREVPPELYADLRERVPQALLRDLHRPVRNFVATPEEIEGTAVRGQWKLGREELKQALKHEPIPVIESALLDVRATQMYQRSLREEPWQPMFPDEAPRREIPSELPPEDDDE